MRARLARASSVSDTRSALSQYYSMEVQKSSFASSFRTMVCGIYMNSYWLADVRYSDSGRRGRFFSPFNCVKA